MGRKKQDPTFIKSIRVNEDIKEFFREFGKCKFICITTN